jgi:hypothetical protein
MLMAWFDKNADPVDINACNILYCDFPEHDCFNKSLRRWTKRVRACKVIGRLPIVPLSYGEKWYLRLLLKHVPGPKCWNDLYSYNWTRYSTFCEVSVERGLFAYDNEFEAALTEGTLYLMRKQMRSMFVTILVYGHPANSLDLWNKFKEHLCQHL